MAQVLFITLIGLFGLAGSYNLEGRLPLYKTGPKGGTFGFSVALHKTSSDSQETLEKSLLVVGSPTAGPLPDQTNTKKPGGIFYCPVTTNPEDCMRVQMDLGESVKDDNKTGQWLGVSLKSQGAGRYLITCAHRYSRSFNTGQHEIERLCGKCFLLNSTDQNTLREITPAESGHRFIGTPCLKVAPSLRNDPEGLQYAQGGTSVAFVSEREYILASPCDQINEPARINYKNTLGYSQSGVSISLVGNELLSGGPGMWSWSGGMFDFQLPNLEAEGADLFVQSSDMHLTLGCRYRELELGRTTKCDNIPLRRDGYIGFAVATSESMFPGSVTYVAGAPRGNATGAVTMYRKMTDSEGNVALHPLLDSVIMGDSMGSSFGFSLAVTDLNNDGLDDLLVGAPQYYQYNNKGKYGGAVYVYINDPSTGWSNINPQTLYGPLDSFFGYSIEAMGDLDQDGFNDFAVGAPYELPNGKIYIYRGSADGMVKQAQVLKGEDYTGVSSNYKGFGVSLSSKVDIDNNQYPDLLAGTLGDHVILFRSRPIITVRSSLETNPLAINLRNPTCEYKRKMYSCFDVKFCFTYNARHNEYTELLPIEYSLTLDTGVVNEGQYSRAHFQTPVGPSTLTNNVVLPSAGTEVCPDGFMRVYFGETSKDRLRPIKVDFKFNLESDNQVIKPETTEEDVFQMINDPILDADYPNTHSSLVTLANTCGDDGCQSNLKVNGTLPPEVVVGNTGKIILLLEVTNDGEEAHQAFVTAKLPPFVFYENYTVVKSSGANIECFSSDTAGTAFVTCSLGNPYDSGSSDTIEIDLDVGSLDATTKKILVEVTGSTTSSNPEIPPVPLVSNVIIQLNLNLASLGRPQQVRYTNSPIIGESAIKYTNEVGPKLSYNFIVKNEGLNTAEGIKLRINFPFEIKNGKWLLYLVSTNVRSGASTVAGGCNETYVNELGYHLPLASSRDKRAASTPAPLYEPERMASTRTAGSYRSEIKLDCPRNTAFCVPVDCALSPIPPKSTTSVILQLRLWNNTFLEEFKKVDLVNIITEGTLKSSEANVRINGTTKQTIQTTVDHAFFEKDVISVFPWWYILIGIILALIIYIVIICLLIKCGFFKRKRYPRQRQEPDEFVLVDEDGNDEKKEKAETNA